MPNVSSRREVSPEADSPWRQSIVGHADVDPRTLTPHPQNWRTHPATQTAALQGSLNDLGWLRSLTVNQVTGHILDGHDRLALALNEGAPTVPVEYVALTPEQEAQALLMLDPIAALAGTDTAQLAALLQDVQSGEPAIQQMLSELAQREGLVSFPGEEPGDVSFDDADEVCGGQGSLAARFLVPPFSVLDARQGYWQDRKRSWIALGIQSELGRGDNIVPNGSQREEMSDGAWRRHPRQENGLLGESQQARSHYHASPGGSLRDAMTLTLEGHTQRGDGTGKAFARTKGSGAPRDLQAQYADGKRLAWVQGQREDLDDTSRKNLAAGRQAHTAATSELMDLAGGFSASHQSGTSIFDPVLCELAYRWFCAPGGTILDPFAGGSVRGIVAARLGRAYTGIDLRAEQVAANNAQWDAIGGSEEYPPAWVVGDSLRMDALALDATYDFIFTCPPYADLEVYSDHSQDLSTMAYPAFLTAYRQIIAGSVARLRHDRFACIVVDDIRDAQGHYRNFVSETIAAFQAAGAMLYNEAILVTMAGSLPLRAAIPFTATRKLGKTHQNVLVFVKGDARTATMVCGPVEVAEDIAAMGPEAPEIGAE